MSVSLFDFLFQTQNALAQVMLVVVGLVFFAIGAALIYDHYRWLRQAKKVRATVVGLRVDDSDESAIYYPVIEYPGPKGQPIQAESDSGSSSYISKVPGTMITAYIMPDKPEVFRLPGRLFLILGFFLSAGGVGLCGVAVVTMSVTIYTPIVALIFCIWAALNFRKHVKRGEKREGVEAFKARRKKKFADKRGGLKMLDRAGHSKIQKKHDAAFRKWLWLWWLIALGTIGAGVWAFNDMRHTLAVGIHAQGEIVGMEVDRDSDSTSYYPIVRFYNKDGLSLKFKDNVGSNPPSYRVGDEVDVIYMPEDSRDAMIDRGVWNWVLAGALFVFGALMLFGLLSQSRRVNRRLMRK